jgi:hypothetical protein
MFTLRLPRFDTGQEHLWAAIDRGELYPALPHPVLRMPADCPRMVGPEVILNWLIERHEDFSHCQVTPIA